MKRSIAVLFVVALAFTVLAGCSTMTAIESKITGLDWVGFAEQAISGTAAAEKLSRIGIGLPCKFGLLDADICSLYTTADEAAKIALPKLQAALAAYKADKSAGNESLLKEAYNELCLAWETFNSVNGVADTKATAMSTTVTTPIQ
jgi:hypothetical protein